MPVNSADQGIPEQQGADPAYLPSAQASWDGVMENRLFRRYTSVADRAARTVSTTENSVSALAAEDRVDISDSVNWISLYSRSVRRARIAVGGDQTLTVSSTTLQNVTALVVPVDANAITEFDVVLFFDGPTAGDIKFSIAGPAGATGWFAGPGPITGIASNAGDGVWGVATSLSPTSISYGTSGTGTGNSSFVRLMGEMTTVGTAGNLQVQAAQNTADPGNTVIRNRSRLHAWRVL